MLLLLYKEWLEHTSWCHILESGSWLCSHWTYNYF